MLVPLSVSVKLQKKAQLADAVDLAFRYDSEIIVEENIEGFEVGCAVLGNDELILGRVDEIELSHGFFDYKEKIHTEDSEDPHACSNRC